MLTSIAPWCETDATVKSNSVKSKAEGLMLIKPTWPNRIGVLCMLLTVLIVAQTARCADTDTKTLRMFSFAGQSNMVGTHSRVADI